MDVRDIASAHLAIADYAGDLPTALNVGTGKGGSVREVIAFVAKSFGHTEVVALELERRAGDPAFLCAEVSLIKKTLGFSAAFSLQVSTESLF